MCTTTCQESCFLDHMLLSVCLHGRCGIHDFPNIVGRCSAKLSHVEFILLGDVHGQIASGLGACARISTSISQLPKMLHREDIHGPHPNCINNTDDPSDTNLEAQSLQLVRACECA